MSDQLNSELNRKEETLEHTKLDTEIEGREQTESPLSRSPEVFKLSEYNRRRERRPLSRTPRSSPLVGVVNSLILVIGLTLNLASRCENSNHNPSEDNNWLKHLITPKDLHLPPSVTDELIKKKKEFNGKPNTVEQSTQSTVTQDME